MSRLCCPGCRLRFSRSVEVQLSSCPVCGLPPAPVSGPQTLLGYRLYAPVDDPNILPLAMEVSMPAPAFVGRAPQLDLGRE